MDKIIKGKKISDNNNISFNCLNKKVNIIILLLKAQ